MRVAHMTNGGERSRQWDEDFSDRHGRAYLRTSFRDAPLGAGPESILTMVVMDSQVRNCAP